MRKSLWIVLTVLLVAIGAPIAHADTVTLDVSGSLSPSGTLGGDIVINNTTGTVISVDITVAGTSLGPFNKFIEFIHGTSNLITADSADDLFEMILSGNPGTLVGYTGGGISDGSNITTLPPNENFFSVNPGAALTAAVTPAPEPSSVALMLLGVGLLFVMRKRVGQGLPQAS